LKKSFQIPVIIGSAAYFLSCTSFAQSKDLKIAFLADIHLQDVYADLESEEFQGVYNPKTGKYATIRSMKSQLNSTRLFNENYFAFLQALQDVNSKGIKLVVLPGDFTDDGQPMNVLALKQILETYSKMYGMRFFITTGNHDPAKPFSSSGGKRDFIGKDGSEQAIAGDKNYFSLENVAISKQVDFWGYSEITSSLSDFGFFPSEKDHFWTHPFEELNVEGYEFGKAFKNSDLSKRTYQSGAQNAPLPDASYLVEPIQGLWLLALDGNVYSENGGNWKGSSVGFNQASLFKKHQLEWIKKVVTEARRLNKTLISFSHYPLVDFHDQASGQMKRLFGSDKFQLARVPSSEVSQLYVQAGIEVHFAGHMHINDTGIFQDSVSGKKLYNIQVPSLAAFPPAYKVLRIPDLETLEIETMVLKNVERMDEFFDLYRMEYNWLIQNQSPSLWDIGILESKNYEEYTRNHLSGLANGRFLPSDWPKELVTLLRTLSFEDLRYWASLSREDSDIFLNEKLLASPKLLSDEPETPIIIHDFYLIKNGDDLGKRLISKSNQRFYESIFRDLNRGDLAEVKGLGSQLFQFFQIFEMLYFSLPSDHFKIDLRKNELIRID